MRKKLMRKLMKKLMRIKTKEDDKEDNQDEEGIEELNDKYNEVMKIISIPLFLSDFCILFHWWLGHKSNEITGFNMWTSVSIICAICVQFEFYL